MTVTSESSRARRYLLGHATDEECRLLEQAYLADENALERMAAAEDELIEDYLSGDLSPSERESFERGYLAAPQHRMRVETVRRLTARAERRGSGRARRSSHLWVGMSRGGWLALAASLVAVASILLWRFSSPTITPTDIAQTREAQPTQTGPAPSPVSPAPAPRVFALTISPVAVRGGDSSAIAVPPDTDVIEIRLQSDADSRQLTPRRASIQTVTGSVIWQGAVHDGASAGLVARVDVPVKALPPDDYSLILYGVDQGGVERELNRYFMPLRFL